MASKRHDRQTVPDDSGRGAARWLRLGGFAALLLAALAVLMAWQRAQDDRHASEDVKARVAAEMNRIEAEARRIEREAAK
jgi:hypothetical protein